MFVNSPGKILFYGGYSVLFENHVGLSIAVVDNNNKGVYAHAKKGDERIVSEQFALNIKPSFSNHSLVNYAFLTAKHYLLNKGAYTPGTIILKNSPIFGDDKDKSGLGSSAAATATTIKALFAISGFSPSFHKETIFKLSQIAYALYSNKIGSGFDIATAIEEQTIIYNRYSPEQFKIQDIKVFLKNIHSIVDTPWKSVKIIPFKIPEKYSILFFNIKGAKTSTISSVKSFNKLKQENPELLLSLMEKQNRIEERAIEALKNSIDLKIREYTHRAREIHKTIGNEAMGLPIEPEELTNIIEEAENLSFVVAGRAPGAGGYDGLAFIVHKNNNPRDIIDIGKEYSLDLKHIPLKIL